MALDRITVDPEQMGGVPCLRRLRIPVATVVGMVADGMTEREILAVLTRFRRLAPRAPWEDFVRTAARTPEGRRALAAFHRARRLLAFTAAKREALAMLLGRHHADHVRHRPRRAAGGARALPG